MAKKQDLNKLLEEVVKDVTDILAKAEESEKTLAKADPGEETPGEETPAGSSAEGSAPSAPEASPAQSDQGPPETAPEATEDQSQEAPQGDQDPAMDESSGPEALQAEYAKLPVEELKLHVMAAHAALMAAMGADQGQPGQDPAQDPAQGQPQPGTPPEATPGAAPEATQQMGKSEKPGKSELELRLETLEKALGEKDVVISQLEEKFGKAAEGIKTFIEGRLSVGLRKSLSGVSYDSKPGTGAEAGFKPMAKSEAIKKLNELTGTKDLKKSDRDLITKYVLGNADQSTVAYLLNK